MKSKYSLENYPRVDEYTSKKKYNLTNYPVVEDEGKLKTKPNNVDNESLVEYFARKLRGNVLEPGAEFLKKNPTISKGVKASADFLDPINKAVEWTGLPQFAANALQGAANTGTSIANIPLSAASAISGKNMNIPMFNLEQHFPEEQQGGPASIAGDFAGQGLGAGSLYKGLGAVQKYGPKALASTKGFTGYLKDILKGATAGYATGATKEGEGELSDIGRFLSAAGGAGISAVGSGIARTAGLKSKNIAENIRKNVNNEESISTGLYEPVINTAEKAKIDLGFEPFPKSTRARNYLVKQMKKESPEIKSLLDDSPAYLKKLFKQWLVKPNIRNTHNLTKDLGKVSKEYGGKGTPVVERDMAKHAGKFREKLIDSMHSAFNKAGHPELSEGLNEANKHFIENVLPNRIKPIIEHMTSRLGKPTGTSPSRFMKELGAHKDYDLALSEIYPDVAKNQLIKKMGLAIGAPFIGGALGVGGYHTLKPAFEYFNK